MNTKKIIYYTKTDEAPALATNSFLPIIKLFTKYADIDIELKDISLAARILAKFPGYLNEDQTVVDDLDFLGNLAEKPDANIIKLPNISASIPQLKSAIKELQGKGYAIPSYPDAPKNDKDEQIKLRYDKIKGSAVNPVLREGNSDRRAPKAVKNYAKVNPHSMGVWSADSKSHVATMQSGDFYHKEKSITIQNDVLVSIIFEDYSSNKTTLKNEFTLLAGEVIDTSVMRMNNLEDFFKSQIQDAKSKDVLFSLHMKATMMKVSDPIIFGKCVEVFFNDIFKKYSTYFSDIGVELKNGFGDLLGKIESLDSDLQKSKTIFRLVIALNQI